MRRKILTWGRKLQGRAVGMEAEQRGSMQSNILMIVGGLVVFIIGLALAPTVISQAVTAGTTTGIGSFGGVQGVVDLLPLIFVIGLLVIGLGAMIGGGYKAAKGE